MIYIPQISSSTESIFLKTLDKLILEDNPTLIEYERKRNSFLSFIFSKKKSQKNFKYDRKTKSYRHV